REIYQYDQSMGITMMGGFMSWLWVIQAFLIAVLFLAGNYYLWVGMGRIPGAERFRPYTKWLLVVLVLGALVWGTPHTMIADSRELAAMGGSHHPLLGALGVMSAKNTGVNHLRDHHRRAHGARRAIARRDSMGQDAAALAVRALHSRGHLHLADGADGIRAQRHPAALARVADHARHDAVRSDARARLCRNHDQHLRADLSVAGRFHLL